MSSNNHSSASGAPITSPSLLNPPRGVDHSPTPPEEQHSHADHPHLHEAVRVAATHVLPQSPAPREDELPHLKAAEGGAGLDEESEGVLAPRAGEVDLSRESIGDVNAARAEEERMHRPGLMASRVGSTRGGTQTLFSMLGAMPADYDDESDDDDPNSSSDEKGGRGQGVAAGPGGFPQRAGPTRMASSIDAIHRPIAQRQGSVLKDLTPPGSTDDLRSDVSLGPVISSDPRGSVDSGKSSVSAGSIGDVQVPAMGGGSTTLDAATNDQMRAAEQRQAAEERVEIARADAERAEGTTPMATQPAREGSAPDDRNAFASLRQDSGGSGRTMQVAAADVPAPRDGSAPSAGRRRRRTSAQRDAAKAERAERLAVKLKEVFELPQAEELLVEMPCWLLRNLLLQGYMYLTTSHICFFAHMPETDNVVLKTGPMSKRASRTHLYSKFWFVLKNDVLSWFESSTDPYFPKGNVSLQYVDSCDPHGETEIKLRTTQKHYTFSAETTAARDDWIKALQKVIFKTQHTGDNVKIAIPLEAVLSVEKSPTMEFADTIDITVVDSEDSMSVDSYFFAYFRDNDKALEDINDLLARYKQQAAPTSDVRPIRDSTDAKRASIHQETDVPSRPLSRSAAASDTVVAASSFSASLKTAHLEPAKSSSTSTLTKLTSRMNPFASSSKSVNKERTPIPPPSQESTARPSMDSISEDQGVAAGTDGQSGLSSSSHTVRPLPIRADSLTYPPSRTSGPPPPGLDERPKWGTAWLKPSGTTSSASGDGVHKSSSFSLGPKKVTEVFSSVLPGHKSTRESQHSDDQSEPEYSMMESSQTGDQIESEVDHKFHKVFALDEKEVLRDHFAGYLYRVLPVSGRFFISDNYFCFRATQLMYKTKMMIPIKDIINTKPHKAYRMGHSGLLLILKGHEELFLEFGSKERRAHCVSALEAQIEAVARQAKEHDTAGTDHPQTREALILEELDQSTTFAGQPQPPKAALPNSDTAAGGMFSSTTSTFLDFKPTQPMRITCLTIGSRGDVQPYIALCKGLQAEGHHTRIASHAEYKDWVEGHGIEFASVGGDPAELMKMCVDNGMFTVSFLKEGLQKFRGWLDDLLRTSWEACQGSELLIESPSAMGGLHIAEGLGIPYYRAFTMPWTRTRAYPHAFAVPSTKRGGAYNYMTYSAFDQVFWRATAGQINRFRRKVIGIEPTDFNKMEQHKVPFLYNFSASILPPPLDWYEWIHVTGYWFLDKADESSKKQWEPPKELVDFINTAHTKGKKVAYIGFGSIVVSDAKEMTQCIVDAVVESDVWCILSKGWSDRGDEKDGGKKEDKKDDDDGVKMPEQIHSVESIDHGWLFPQIDLAVHHGGAGTTGASLRAGIPTIIRPFFGDQFLWADRVEALNIGSSLRKFNKDHLVEALKEASTNEKQIQKAKTVGEAIRSENGVAKAIEAIYRDLDYAKSLIKPRPSPAESQRLKTADTQSFGDGEENSESSGVDGSHNSQSEDWSVLSGVGSEKPLKAVDSRDSAASDAEEHDDFDQNQEVHGEKRQPKKSKSLLSNLGHMLPGKLGTAH